MATPLKNKLQAPFVYPGGKRRVADIVWPRLGQTWHYVEPFCGSAAMLLACPWVHKLEVINDKNFYVANFWRAIKHQPEEVTKYASGPCVHIELIAKHNWLVNSEQAQSIEEKMMDLDWEGDAKVAGYWVWGMAHFIGPGFCEKKKVPKSIPDISNLGQGVGKKIPNIGGAGVGVGKSVDISEWMLALQKRLARVRVINGDWNRCLNFCYGTNNRDRNGSVSYFFDPPYKSYEKLYKDKQPVASEVEAWCLEHGNNPKLRIALCGFEGDYNLPGWEQVKWKRAAGFNGSSKTAHLETIWFSPHCLKEGQDEKENFDDHSTLIPLY